MRGAKQQNYSRVSSGLGVPTTSLSSSSSLSSKFARNKTRSTIVLADASVAA
jgi:hypothetical protein